MYVRISIKDIPLSTREVSPSTTDCFRNHQPRAPTTPGGAKALHHYSRPRGWLSSAELKDHNFSRMFSFYLSDSSPPCPDAHLNIKSNGK